VQRGIMVPSGDPSNCIGIGVKAIGGGSNGQPMCQTTCVVVRHNIVTDFPKSGGYINQLGGDGKTQGCSHIVYHDNLFYRLCAGSDSWGISSSASAGTAAGFSCYGGVNACGFRGPWEVQWKGNTIHVLDSASPTAARTIDKSNSIWIGDSGPNNSAFKDNVFAYETEYGFHNTSGDPHPPIGAGEEWEGCDMEYNAVDTPSIDTDTGWPATTFEATTPNTLNTYVDANYALTASGIAAWKTAIGVGAGGQIASGESYIKSDGSTGTRTVAGADIADLISLFGDVNNPNVASTNIRYP